MKRSHTARRRATRSSFSAPFCMTKNTSTSLSARIACCVTYSGSPAPSAGGLWGGAWAACAQTGGRLRRLGRPPFHRDPAIDWREVGSLDEAAGLLPQAGRRVFLTTGRQGLGAFSGIADAFFLIRCVDAPDPQVLPPDRAVVLDRGPFTLAGELALIDRHALDVLITKDSGGEMTQAKLAAARRRGLPVIVVARPPRPGVPTVQTVEEALTWLGEHAHDG